jgi:hypothetical protein
MRHGWTAAFTLSFLLAGANPPGPHLAHPGRAVDPSALPAFGAKVVPDSAIDWTSLAFMGLWASVVVIVFVLWYRKLRFDEDLEGGRPRMPGDEK